MKEMLHMYLEIEDTEVSEKIEAYLKAKRELIAALSNEGIKAKETAASGNCRQRVKIPWQAVREPV